MSTLKVAAIMMCLVVVTVVCGAGCGHDNNWQVSTEEATSVLNQAVAYAQAHDLEKLGVLAQDESMTQENWELAGGWETVPAEPPKIVDTYLLPTVYLKNGSQATGGRVLVLEGSNGLGKPYRTEFLVFREGSTLVAGNVIYWSGCGIVQYSEDGSELTTGPSPSP